MPSLRSRFFKLILKYYVGAKFRRAGTSVAALRNMTEFIVKNQKIPAGTDIRPVSINGLAAEWVCGPGVQPDNAVLMLHGGAFIMCSPATHRELAARLSVAMNTRMLVLDYRLAPEHPFPAAMEDTISAYRWLLNEGYPEKRLAIGGDSAGGGLTLQTLIALRDEGGPLPAAAFFLSPVTDWVRFDGESYKTRAGIDPLNTPDVCKFTAALYVGDNAPDTSLLSPVHMDLSGLPPLCIHTGDQELLLSDSVRLAERARAANVEVTLKIWPGMWHVFQSCAQFVPEARRSINEIGGFIRNHLG